jgi:hypothetical protein
MSGKRKVTPPARGKPWPAFLVKRAVELLTETKSVTATRKALKAAYSFGEGDPPARSTLAKWAQNRGIELDVAPDKNARETTAATSARLARLEEGRAELSELLLEKLSRPAVEELDRRLQEAREAEALVTAARQAYQDALTAVAMTRDLEKDSEPKARRAAIKEAMGHVYQTRQELAFAMDFRIGVRDLVGLLTRALGDHLALEGLDADDAEVGDLIVELNVPRPDPRQADAEAVPQAQLKVIPGGGGR